MVHDYDRYNSSRFIRKSALPIFCFTAWQDSQVSLAGGRRPRGDRDLGPGGSDLPRPDLWHLGPGPGLRQGRRRGRLLPLGSTTPAVDHLQSTAGIPAISILPLERRLLLSAPPRLRRQGFRGILAGQRLPLLRVGPACFDHVAESLEAPHSGRLQRRASRRKERSPAGDLCQGR